jgi:hypothetical protein
MYCEPMMRLGFLTHVNGHGDAESTYRQTLELFVAADRLHAFYGHPDEVTAALRTERVLPLATDLFCQFNPGVPGHDAALRALELIATEVAPALGWRRAT